MTPPGTTKSVFGAILAFALGCPFVAVAQPTAVPSPTGIATRVGRDVKLSERAAERLRARPELYGSFHKITPGSAAIEANDPQIGDIPVENPDVLPAQVRELHEPKVSFEVTPRGTAVITSIDLGTTSRWKQAQWSSDARFRPLTAEYDEIDRKFAALKAEGNTVKDLEELKQGFEKAVEIQARIYASLPEEAAGERAAVREQYRSIQQERKALYGSARDDNYPPQSYLRIYERSQAAVAISTRGSADPHCSGFLIGRDRVLTAQHCLDGVLPDEVEVVFGYEDPADSQSVVEKVGLAEVLASGSDLGGLDAALVRISDLSDGHPAGDRVASLCLSARRAMLDDPVYVVGYPQGRPRTVHDNSFVRFPFLVTEFDFQQLKLRVDSEFEDAEDGAQRITEFTDSYQRGQSDGTTVYRNYSVRLDKQPTIGIDSDTFGGDSGAPALDRRTHRAIGIFVGGETDTTSPYSAGWRRHEALLPITEVISKLDALDADWRTEGGICIGG